MRHKSPLGLITLALVVFMTALVGPVAAATPETFGAFMRCNYVTVTGAPDEIELRKIAVYPPNLEATTTPGELRGWQFMIRMDGQPIYKSNIQWRRADTSGHLDFDKRVRAVGVPGWPEGDATSVWGYRIVMRIYRSTGLSRATFDARFALQDSRTFVDGEFESETGPTCFGRIREAA